MSTIQSNKKTRDVAVPFVAVPFHYGTPATVGWVSSDADDLTASGTLVIIRCATPNHINLIESHLHLVMTIGSALTVKVAIGEFDTDNITAITSYTQDQIDASHKKLTGTDSAIASSGSTLLIDGLNLLPDIPKRGDSDFNEIGFVLILQFSRARTGSDSVLMFDVLCSALMGLL